MKYCPMCGEAMRLTIREVLNVSPGRSGATVPQIREWICPECDYFEEADAGEG